MNRQIAYKEDDLKSSLTFMLDMITQMDAQVNMMEEQALSLRHNLDWKSSAANLRVALEKIKGIVDGFKIVDIEYDQMLQVESLCFRQEHVEQIEERFSKIDME